VEFIGEYETKCQLWVQLCNELVSQQYRGQVLDQLEDWLWRQLGDQLWGQLRTLAQINLIWNS